MCQPQFFKCVFWWNFFLKYLLYKEDNVLCSSLYEYWPNAHICVSHSSTQSNTLNTAPFLFALLSTCAIALAFPLKLVCEEVCVSVSGSKGVHGLSAPGSPIAHPPSFLVTARLSLSPLASLACLFNSVLDWLSPPAPSPPGFISVCTWLGLHWISLSFPFLSHLCTIAAFFKKNLIHTSFIRGLLIIGPPFSSAPVCLSLVAFLSLPVPFVCVAGKPLFLQ